jgi:oligosaccharide repeat unit polymerase
MLEILQNIPEQPIFFHLALGLLVLLSIEAALSIGELRWGFACLVYMTIGLWYFVDIVYRPEGYQAYSDGSINVAFMQISIFLLAFRIAVQGIARPVPSAVLRAFDPREFANWETARFLIGAWLILFVIGMARADFSLNAIFPINSRAAWTEQMWARPRFGGSWTFLISIADYCYQLLCASFGVIAVATQNRKIRTLMIGLALLTWPMFMLGGARNQLLAVILPTILSFLIIRNWSRTKQIIFLAVTFVLINSIMLVVIEFRNEGFSSFTWDNNPFFTKKEKIVKHQGLNMLEELMILNEYQERNIMDVEFGGNYFANAVNFVPRGLWKDKPFPGKKFAELRVGYYQGDVAATISHGLVGQGVTNFGRWLGPSAPAILLACFIAWACSYPTRGHRFLRSMMVMVSLAVIPNFGRDITLFSAWPIVFGAVAVRVFEQYFWKKRLAPITARSVR